MADVSILEPPLQRRFSTAEYRMLSGLTGWESARAELLRGVIVKMSPKFAPHARLQTYLLLALQAGIAAVGLSWRVDGECSVDFAEGFQPMPDLVVWDPALALAGLDGQIPRVAVKLVVEVASITLDLDLGPMAQDYAAAMLPEYWVADAKNRLLHRHARPNATSYTHRETSPLALGASSVTISGLAIPAGLLS